MAGRRHRAALLAMGLLAMAPLPMGCGAGGDGAGTSPGHPVDAVGTAEGPSAGTGTDGEAGAYTEGSPLFEEAEAVADPWLETGADGEVDFPSQYGIRPDIVGWVYIPGTEVDCPVLQGTGDGTGDAAYIGQDADPYMTGFLNIIRGDSPEEGGGFATLYDFADPGFFGGHDALDCHTPFGTLHYEVVAAYEQDGGTLDGYDLSDGAGREAFVSDLKAPAIGKNQRDGWIRGLSTDNLYTALVTGRPGGTGKEFVVTAVLTGAE